MRLAGEGPSAVVTVLRPCSARPHFGDAFHRAWPAARPTCGRHRPSARQRLHEYGTSAALGTPFEAHRLLEHELPGQPPQHAGSRGAPGTLFMNATTGTYGHRLASVPDPDDWFTWTTHGIPRPTPTRLQRHRTHRDVRRSPRSGSATAPAAATTTSRSPTRRPPLARRCA